MQEREFQNMFTFSSGFEAATLKIPPAHPSASPSGLGLEEQGQQDMTSPSPTAVAASVASANGAPRKQIIGFAKFRTRMEALEARDILSGRRIDPERGCMLKAEIAKKNLHTKSSSSSSAASPMSSNVNLLPAYKAGGMMMDGGYGYPPMAYGSGMRGSGRRASVRFCRVPSRCSTVA